MPELKAKGVDAVYVLSNNDPFVLSGWTRVQGVADKVRTPAYARSYYSH